MNELFMRVLIKEVIDKTNLSRRQRQVITMKYIEGVRRLDIAEILGVTVGCVDLYTQCGVNRVRKWCKNNHIDREDFYG